MVAPLRARSGGGDACGDDDRLIRWQEIVAESGNVVVRELQIREDDTLCRDGVRL